MANDPTRSTPNLKIIKKHQTAIININITKKLLWWSGILLLTSDLLLLVYSLIPMYECRPLKLFSSINFCDSSIVNSSGGLYLSLKLLLGTMISSFIVYTFRPEEKIPLIWYIIAVTLLYLTIICMLNIQTFWIVRNPLQILMPRLELNLHHLVGLLIPLGLCYTAALNYFVRNYRVSSYWVFVSLLVLSVSQTSEKLCGYYSSFNNPNPFPSIFYGLGEQSCLSSISGGLILISVSAVIISLLTALHKMQQQTVIYDW